MPQLTHINKEGQAKMVHVGNKSITRREAVAFGEVRLQPQTIKIILNKKVPKGNVFEVARLAGIMAAKKCDDLIPLCHSLSLDGVEIQFQIKKDRIRIRSSVQSDGKTGVEMEALVGASVAGLTIYDMCKAVDKEMEVGPIFLARKTGGRSGHYKRPDTPQEWFEKDEKWL